MTINNASSRTINIDDVVATLLEEELKQKSSLEPSTNEALVVRVRSSKRSQQGKS